MEVVAPREYLLDLEVLGVFELLVELLLSLVEEGEDVVLVEELASEELVSLVATESEVSTDSLEVLAEVELVLVWEEVIGVELVELLGVLVLVVLLVEVLGVLVLIVLLVGGVSYEESEFSSELTSPSVLVSSITSVEAAGTVISFKLVSVWESPSSQSVTLEFVSLVPQLCKSIAERRIGKNI